MTAEGTARSGAGEAPKAELAAVAKGVVAEAPPGERPAEEREGVGGPFVIVNGDSDGLSDRGSDTGAGPEAGSPSDEEDLPRTNAGPDADAGGDHGAAGGELDAAVGVPSANGHGGAAVESEDGMGEGKGEDGNNSEAELGEQGTAGGELGGVDAASKLETDHADADADSAAPVVDSEVNGKESETEKSAAPDVAELPVHEAAGEEQHGGANAAAELPVHEAASEEQHGGANAAAESSETDYLPTCAKSASTVLESEVCGEESKGEQIPAETMELGTDGSGAPVVSGHHDADMNVDSCVTATECVSHADEGKHQQACPNVTELVEQDATCGEQDVTDALQGNGNGHADSSPDSCASDSELKAHVDESKGQQVEALETDDEVSDGILDAAVSGTAACTYKDIEDKVVANGHGCVEDSADSPGELEPGVDEAECEATCGVVELEDSIGKDSEGNLHDGKEGINNEAVRAIVGACVITENESEQIVQDDELVKDDVSVGILHSVKPESDSFVGSNGDHNVQVEVAAGDENVTVCDVKADMNTSDIVQTQDLRSAVEDESIPLHVNSSSEVMEKEVNKQPCPEEGYFAQNDYSSVQTGKHEQLELRGGGVADKSDNGVVAAEPREEVVTEFVDDVPLHAPAVSTFHNEPRSIDLVDNDTMKHSSSGTELESGEHVQAEECSSQEISSTTVDQVISDVSMEHGTAATDDVELRYETGDASHEISGETALDQGEPVALSEDKAVVVDDVKPSSATGDESAVVGEARDTSQTDESNDFAADCQSHNDQSEICDMSTTPEELVSPIEESCSPDVVGKDICSQNINACNKSSHEVETTCLEVLEPSSAATVVPEEHNNEGEQANEDEEKIVEDSSESHVDLDKSNKGDIHVMRPQKIFIVKVPKLAGEDVWARIQDAQSHLDRLTQERDAINVRKRKQKVICDEYREKLEAARKEESEARAAHGDKRNDLDSVRSMIGKLNKANSIEEIDEMISRKEKTMEHETISLKEEKLFIKEINELKAQRKQLCSNMGSKAEISEAFHQKDHIHEQHKTLKKDSDLLFKNLKSLADNTRKIQKSYDDERAVLRKLNDELQAANEIRQKAYIDWIELRGEPGKKNKYFFMYKKDHAIANNYLLKGDMEGLQLYCNNQVEGVLEMWNKDDEFRKLYVEANMFSTVRRLGTHDGRRLSPEEDPPVIPSNNFNRRPNNPSPLTVASPNVPIITSEAAPEKPVPVAVPAEQDSFPVLPSSQTHKQAKSKESGNSTQKEITTAPASEREDVKHIEKEKARLMEELELVRKAEELARREGELREQRAAAEKERLRLEQKAKAKEAEERKKKKAEKAQERAEFKARKEAEMKEKKKAKKDKKNGATPGDLASVSGDGNSAALATTDTDSNTSENARDAEVSQQAAPRRIARPAAAMRQLNRLQPMPLPLRNRGKRRTRQYILIGAVVALVAVALILAGRYLNLPGLSLPRF